MKIMRIQTTWLRRIGKVLLWLVLAFIFLRGVVSLCVQDDSDLKQAMDQYYTAAEQRENARLGASSFAEKFVSEYFTYNGEMNSDYEERIKGYLAKALDIKQPAANIVKTEVLSADSFKLAFYKDSQMDVDVTAKIRCTMLATAADGGSLVTEKQLNIRVPVVEQEGKYAVDALPLLIPAQEKAAISQAKGLNGTEVPQDQKKEIQVALESFYKAYYEGNEGELSYYITPDSDIEKGLDGLISFEKINLFSAYYLENQNRYMVESDINVINNGQTLQQHFFLNVVCGSDGKYYIKNISTRAI